MSVPWDGYYEKPRLTMGPVLNGIKHLSEILNTKKGIVMEIWVNGG